MKLVMTWIQGYRDNHIHVKKKIVNLWINISICLNTKMSALDSKFQAITDILDNTYHYILARLNMSVDVPIESI